MSTETAQIRDILDSSPAAEVVEEVPEVEPEVIDEEVEKDAEPAAEVEEEEEAEAAASEGESTKYTIASLAEAIGFEASDLYNDVTIEMQNGESVPLGEYKDKFQEMSHEVTTLQTQLQEAQSNQGQVAEQLSNEMTSLRGQLDQIDRVEQGTNWAEIEELDPTEAILKRDKINRARAEVQGAMGELQGKEQQAYGEFINQQKAKTLEMIPAWKDNKVLESEQSAILTVMREYGFTDAESHNMVDPRQMKIMNDFAKLKTKGAAAAEALKKVRKAPQVIGNGRQTPASKPEEAVTKIVNKAKKSGDKHDILAAQKAIWQS